MDIRFVSSLTPDDENRLAPAVLDALGGILDQLPIAYTLQIGTTAGKSFAHNHVPDGRSAAPRPGDVPLPDLPELESR